MNRRNFIGKALLVVASGFGLGKLFKNKKDQFGGERIYAPYIPAFTTKNKVLQTLDKTITIKEFKSLKQQTSPRAYGNYSFGEKFQKRQCENIEIGDTVFFMEARTNLKDPDVVTNVTLVSAKIV